MDLAKYLQRIDYGGEVSPTLEVLKLLQKKHRFNVPFENLDIHYRNHIDLDIKKIYDKIVNRNRGGLCYELNGLFYELLKSIGFHAKLVSARVHKKEGEYTPEFDHMAIIVRIDKTDFLADVGFGEFAFYPLKIETGNLQHDLRKTYRIEAYDETYLQVIRQDNRIWVPEYIFTLRGRELKEFEAMCNYHQTSSKSHFQQKKICSLPTRSGRTTVSSDKVKINQGGEIKEFQLTNEREFRAALWDHLQVKL